MRKASADICVEIRSHPQLLQAVRGLVRGYAGGFGLSKDKVDEIVLAVDEACCNSIRHSYKNAPDQTLYFTLRATDEALELELRDTGAPALPERVQRKKLGVPDFDSLSPGGLGMPFIYAAFDEVEFIPGEERGNCLIMRIARVGAGSTVAKGTGT